MNSFTYSAPSTLAEAVSLLSGPSIVPLAGGTDLLVQIRSKTKLPKPTHLVDIKKIPEMAELRFDENTGLVVGAAVTCAELYRNQDVRIHYPGLADCVSLIGGQAIQERATIGGNLCNASPSADTIPSLIVLDAACNIAGPAGSSSSAARDFCISPGKSILRGGELLVGLTFPPPAQLSSSAYIRFTPRHEMDIAVAGAAAWVKLDENGRVADARIALSAVGPTPIPVDEASDEMKGREPGSELIERTADICARTSIPISDLRGKADYRNHLVRVLVKRALYATLERIEGGVR